MRSVVEQFPELARNIGQEFGVAGGELASFAKKNDGILTTERIIKAINQALPDLDKRFAETSDTVGRALARFSNAFVKVIGEIGQTSGAMKLLANTITFVAKNLETLIKVLGTLITLMSVSFFPNLLRINRRAGLLAKTFRFVTNRLILMGKAMVLAPFSSFLIALTATTIALTIWADDIRFGELEIISLRDEVISFISPAISLN